MTDTAQRWKQASAKATVVYALKPLPEKVVRTVFLAGPTPRKGGGESWRASMIEMLESEGFDGHIFVPEPPDSNRWAEDYSDQVEWEEEALHRADCIIFWVPRDVAGIEGSPMPGLTTNDEWGYWKESGKVVFGAPPEAEKVRYQQHYAQKFGVPTASTLRDVAKQAVKMVGKGSVRVGGEAQVSIQIWSKPEFQGWYESQKAAGNRLDGARVVWGFRVPSPNFNDSGKPPARLFLYSVHVDMHVASEGRNKRNEIVLFRPDISSVVLYHRPLQSFDPVQDTKVVLVKEFRSPARNDEGFVYELPGGSSTGKDPVAAGVTALQEVEEEVGLDLDPERLRHVGTRQIGVTLSAHTCSLYAVPLTSSELAKLEEQAASGVALGESATERCYTVVKTFGEILNDQLVDWSQMGMIYNVLTTN